MSRRSIPRSCALLANFIGLAAACRSDSVSATMTPGPQTALMVPAAAPSTNVIVSLDAVGHVSLDGMRMNDDALRARLRARVTTTPALSATLTSPSNVPYARVVQVMDIVRVCGIQDMSMVAPSH